VAENIREDLERGGKRAENENPGRFGGGLLHQIVSQIRNEEGGQRFLNDIGL